VGCMSLAYAKPPGQQNTDHTSTAHNDLLAMPSKGNCMHGKQVAVRLGAQELPQGVWRRQGPTSVEQSTASCQQCCRQCQWLVTLFVYQPTYIQVQLQQ
jgi:hypothetical protein